MTLNSVYPSIMLSLQAFTLVPVVWTHLWKLYHQTYNVWNLSLTYILNTVKGIWQLRSVTMHFEYYAYSIYILKEALAEIMKGIE